MLLKKSFYQLAVILLTMSFVFSPEVFGAQNGKNVVFPKGKNSISYSGRLPRNYGDYDYYVLKGKAKQTLTVKLKTANPDAYVQIFETENELGPDEDMITGDERGNEWSGKLPVASKYSIQVYGAREGTTSNREPYTIEISLK